MVLYVQQYDVNPDKAEAFTQWATESAIPRILKIPGLNEFRSYRPVAGSHQIAVTYEFADMAALAAWLSHADYQKMLAEFRTFVGRATAEVWGPSPVVPEPLRPKK